MDWDTQTQEKFKLMISKMPIFHRRIAEEAAVKKALENAANRNAGLVGEEEGVATKEVI